MVSSAVCKGCRTGQMYPPHYVPGDSFLVQTLLKSYKAFTERDEKPVAGGGTYVHRIENGVAFGCADKNIDNHMHGADEFISVDQMLLSAEIYADAILRLCTKCN
jgi:succinyl-diaminopimelate desuccinylase